MEPATFRLVAQCRNQLRHHTLLTETHASYKRGTKLRIENLEKIIEPVVRNIYDISYTYIDNICRGHFLGLKVDFLPYHGSTVRSENKILL
jgi:hypothetical protein